MENNNNNNNNDDVTNGVIGYHQVAPRRDPACIRDPASIKTSDLKPPACIGDPASIKTLTHSLTAALDQLRVVASLASLF